MFRLLAALVLLPLGVWLVAGRPGAPVAPERLGRRWVSGASLVVGVIGGLYGVGGGSLLGPLLPGRGVPVGTVAPAALTSTFVTSIVGAGTYAVLGAGRADQISPDWALGLACGAGGLVGGYLGARLQPHLPERGLRRLLGLVAAGLGVTYMLQSLA